MARTVRSVHGRRRRSKAALRFYAVHDPSHGLGDTNWRRYVRSSDTGAAVLVALLTYARPHDVRDIAVRDFAHERAALEYARFGPDRDIADVPAEIRADQ